MRPRTAEESGRRPRSPGSGRRSTVTREPSGVNRRVVGSSPTRGATENAAQAGFPVSGGNRLQADVHAGRGRGSRSSSARPTRSAWCRCWTGGRIVPQASSAGRRCASWTVMLPAPTAEATRLSEPWRTSPPAKTPGRHVSSSIGGRSSGHGKVSCAVTSGPVSTSRRGRVAEFQPRQARPSAETDDIGPEADPDRRRLLEPAHEVVRHARAQARAADHDCDRSPRRRHVHCRLAGRVAGADDEHGRAVDGGGQAGRARRR
jgi:hypothetical protein